MTLEIPDHLYKQLCRYADEHGIKEGQSLVAFALSDACSYQRLRHAVKRALDDGENGLARRG